LGRNKGKTLSLSATSDLAVRLSNGQPSTTDEITFPSVESKENEVNFSIILALAVYLFILLLLILLAIMVRSLIAVFLLFPFYSFF